MRRRGGEGSELRRGLLEGEGAHEDEAVETGGGASPAGGGGEPNAVVAAFLWLVDAVKAILGLGRGTVAPVRPPVDLSPVQAERKAALGGRAAVAYDAATPQHADLLRRLFALAFPGQALPADGSLKTPTWKEMGWQGVDPGSDFRGGGLLSLEMLVYLAEKRPDAFKRLVFKTEGKRSELEYPMAVAGVQITFALVEMLELKDPLPPPQGTPAAGFLAVLENEEDALEELFCAMFERLDREWLHARASYFEFNPVMQTTKQAVANVLSKGGVASVNALRAALVP